MLYKNGELLYKLGSDPTLLSCTAPANQMTVDSFKKKKNENENVNLHSLDIAQQQPSTHSL
jgi:hypothetical protein